jgi:SPP1 gp7 family putative phage head morphogenesis protein
MNTALKESQQKAGRLAARHAYEQAEAAGLRNIIPVTPSGVVNRGAKTLSSRMAKASDKFGDDIFEDIGRQFLAGAVRSEEIGTVAHRLERAGGMRGMLPDFDEHPAVVADNVADTFLGRMGNIAERLIRTEVANAYTEQMTDAIETLADENDVVMMKRWDATIDRVTCEECDELHGDTVEVDEEFSGDGGDGPPAHCNCRCTITVWIEKKDVNAAGGGYAEAGAETESTEID